MIIMMIMIIIVIMIITIDRIYDSNEIVTRSIISKIKTDL